MDTGRGDLATATDREQAEFEEHIKATGAPPPRMFRVGDIVDLWGIKFRIKSIKPTELRLKLMPKGAKK